MANIIVFLSLFLIYIIATILYLKKSSQNINSNEHGVSKEKLEAELLYITRNVLFLTGITFVVNSFVLLNRDFGVHITSSQIGLILAIGTVVFYSTFTIWDVLKYRLANYFQNKFGIEVDKKVLFGGTHIVIMTTFSILLVEVVLSIITIIALWEVGENGRFWTIKCKEKENC